MRRVNRILDTEEAKARARLMAHFVDHPEEVFYSRQLEVIFEREYFHWVTNRAVRALVAEGFLGTESRRLSIGSEIKLVWNKKFRFYKRAATDVFDLVDRYSSSATDGTLGMQGEHLVLAAFARRQFLLIGEETKAFREKTWTQSGHDLDFIFEKDGVGYGIEVKNTLGYMDVGEFVTKIRLARFIGVKPVFAVRMIPKTWTEVLIRSGGYAMIMGFQFYPWTHKDLADTIRDQLSLPVDTPKKIELGTMQRFEKWIASTPSSNVISENARIEAMLERIATANVPKKGNM
jgi:hypothetical protein